MTQRRADAQIEAWQLRIPLATEQPGWRQHIACRGLTTLMYPQGTDSAKAVAICHKCPVRLSCLADARDTECGTRSDTICGIRGGLTATQRHAVYRTLRPPRLRPACGTNNGYHSHLRNGEETCTECREAHARHNRDYDTKPLTGHGPASVGTYYTDIDRIAMHRHLYTDDDEEVA